MKSNAKTTTLLCIMVVFEDCGQGLTLMSGKRLSGNSDRPHELKLIMSSNLSVRHNGAGRAPGFDTKSRA